MKRLSIIVLFLLTITTIVHADIWLTRTGPIYMSCSTHSMYPAFTCYDNLTIATPKDRFNMNVGDIVWVENNQDIRDYYNTTGAIMHRIVSWHKEIVEVKINGTWYTKYQKTTYHVKGDNNTYIDPYNVDAHDIVFVVTSINGKKV